MSKRNIRLLEIQDIGMGAVFFLPILVVYFRDEIGLNFQDFLLTEAIFAATVLLMEVPSGWLADIWQRRRTLMAANLFWGAGLYLLLIADGFLMAALSQSMIGVGYALRSGANSAMLYDTLIEHDMANQFLRLEGRRKGFSFYSAGAASFCGGFLYEIDHALPLWVSIAFIGVSFIASFFYVEPARRRAPAHANPLADMASSVWQAIKTNPVVGLLIVLAASFFSASKNIALVQQPYYIALELPEYSFGVLLSVGTILGGFASQVNHLIGKNMSNMQVLGLCWVAAMLVSVLAAIAVGWHGVVLLMFGGTFVYGLSQPRILDAINKRVGPERRATILSGASFGREIVFIPLSLIVGWAATNYGVAGSLYVVVLWLAVAGLALVIWQRAKAMPN